MPAGLATLLFDLLTPDEKAIDVVTAELRFDIDLLSRRTIATLDWLPGQPLLTTLPVGLFVAEAEQKLALPVLEQLAITDSVVPFLLSAGFVARKLTVLDGSRQVAEAIRRLHDNGSLVELLGS